MRDLKSSFRIFTKSPLVAFVVVLSLGLGIGVNMTIFTLVDAVLLDSLPVSDPDRLVSFFTVDQRFVGGPRGSHHQTSLPNFEDYRDRNKVFSHLAAYTPISLALLLDEKPEEITGQAVTTTFFEMLKMPAAAGRFFSHEENGPQSALPVVVLSHLLWQSRFGGAADAVGRTLSLNGHPFEIIGVAPAGFTGPRLEFSSDLWVPMMMRDQLFSGALRLYHERRRALMFWLLGRLEEGVSLQQAETAVKELSRQLAEEYPKANQDRTATLVPLLQSNIRPDQRQYFTKAGGILMLVAGSVLLLVCANVGHLLMVRVERRRTELSLRLALGSSFAALIRQLLLENLILVSAGTAFGVLLASWWRDLLWGLRPPILANAQPDLSFDLDVLAFTAVTAFVAILLSSLAPALRVSQVELASVLRELQIPPRASRVWNVRGFLVTFQIALSLLTLIVSGLFYASLEKAQSVDPGFAAEKLGVFSYNLGVLGYEPDRGLGFHRRVVEQAQALPEVQAVALASIRPLNQRFSGFLRTVIPEGLDLEDPRNGQLITTNFVNDQYLTAFEIPIVAGRDFHAGDRADSHRVAIVNETLAAELWNGDDPLGRRLFVRGVDGPCEVVGVARDSKYNSVGETPVPFLYLPLEQSYTGKVQLFVNTTSSPDKVIASLRDKLQDADPRVPLSHLSTMSQERTQSLWALRLCALLLGMFGVVATVLAAVGILGVMAYSVNSRKRELGLRMALGAQHLGLVALILRQGMTLVAVGILAGWVATTFFSRLLSSLLFGVEPFDLAIYASSAVFLASVALIVNLVSAVQAICANPLLLLREG